MVKIKGRPRPHLPKGSLNRDRKYGCGGKIKK